MRFKNSNIGYGLLSIVLHWLSAVLLFFLFAIGLWMTELDYYSPWYNSAPMLHISFGLLLLVLTVYRLFWHFVSKPPTSVNIGWQKIVEKITHKAIYLLLFIVLFSGYLIVNADDKGVQFFNIITIPNFIGVFYQQEDIAGMVHELVSYVLMFVVLLHVAAAFFHFFIKHDKTMLRVIKYLKE